jgi:hypothetical protein
MARRAKKTSLNFKGVEGKTLIPAGDYASKVVEVSVEKGQGDYNYFKWVFEITEGKYKGKKLFTNTSHNPAALWNLKNLLVALGVEVPDGEMEFDLEEFVDMEVTLVVDEDEYNGKPQSRVVDYYPSEGRGSDDDADEADDEEEDEKPVKKGKAKAAPKKGKAKDEDDEDEDEEEEEKPAPKKRGRPAGAKNKPKDDDEDEDEDEEEEEKVSKKGKGKKPKLKPIDADTLSEMDEDELTDVIDTYELDVDLDDYKTIKKKIAAVSAALDEIDMLTE